MLVWSISVDLRKRVNREDIERVERRACIFHVLMLIRSILVGLRKKEYQKTAEQEERRKCG
jgi:hypothetical protein